MLTANNSLRKVCLLFLVLSFSASIFGQKLKNKEVKKLLESGVTSIEVITNDSFIPAKSQEVDLKVTFNTGASVNASDYHFIWDQVTCDVVNAGWKIKGELLTNGKGVVYPYILSKYYSSNAIDVTMTLSGKTASKKVLTNYCIENYIILQKGNDGGDGTAGYEGSSGSNGRGGLDGKNGDPGPDFEVSVNEELIESKTYLILSIGDEKYKLDPACSSVAIISRGGEGGKGGRGGRGGTSLKDNKNEYKGNGGRGGSGGRGGKGGMGGTITVSGNAVEKYKSKITFMSEGGEGGKGGDGGSGGRGKSDGSSGMDGSNGAQGAGGQIIFK